MQSFSTFSFFNQNCGKERRGEMLTEKLSDGNGHTVLENVLHMNSENGPNSYASNSSSQTYALLRARPILEKSVNRVFSKTLVSDQFTVADLGCASGPNSLEAAAVLIEAITGLCRRTGKPPPEVLVFLNDLPRNDFNSVSLALPAFYERLKKEDEEKKLDKGIGSKCFVSVMPGSFYGRLFPSRSLHFVHSANSIHWLSQVPDGLEHNKGSISFASTSPLSVWEAYLKQFQTDFTIFLCSRAHEIIPHGQMVLNFGGRSATSDPRDKRSYLTFLWELLTECLLDMAAEELVEEVDIGSFNMPFYTPSEDEIRDIVERQGSFDIDELETVTMNISSSNGDDDPKILVTGRMLALGTRSLVESMLTSHFRGGLVMDDLFKRYEKKATEVLTQETLTGTVIILSLTKK